MGHEAVRPLVRRPDKRPMEAFAQDQPERIGRCADPRSRAVPEEVRRLVEKLDTLPDARAARVARARRMLVTGRLDAPEVFRETARRIVDAG